MQIKEFYDETTSSFSYVIYDKTLEACVIDSVLDYNHFTGEISHKNADKIVDFIEKNQLNLKYIFETHIHADHLTASHYLKEKFNQAKLAISSNLHEISEYFTDLFENKADFEENIAHFDIFLKEGDKIKIGDFEIEIFETPGHTPCCLSLKIDDNIFVGDLLFAPDIGSARVDFYKGSAENAYNSMKKILNMDENFKTYFAHDYPKNRAEISHVSIKEQNEKNIMINKNISKAEYIAKRQARDASLELPRLIYPSIQVNLCAGNLPKFVKLPISIKK